ncbi:MAG: MFS transporter [Chloroflexaceae bacterium]|jgi:MFS family permease|nr:MFS transporter [Chloroflexaceae bacterium]
MLERAPRRAIAPSPLLFIFIAVFVDLLGYGIVVPLLPLFVQGQGGGATTVGALAALYALAQAVGGPLLAGLSDRLGRRPVLLVCLSGTALAYLLLALADSLTLVALAMLLDGMTGGNLSTAQAYIVDSTAPEERARGFGLVGAAFGLGMVAGPALGGLLAPYGLAAPAMLACAIASANVLFGLFVLPESLPPERRTRPSLLALNPLSQLLEAWRTLPLRGLLLAVLLLNLAFAGLQSNFPLFSGTRFGWDASANAYFFAFVGLCALLTQGLLLGWLRDRFGEARLALAGLGLMAVNLLLMALVPQGWMLYPVVGLLALGSNLSIPTLTSIITARVQAGAHGQLMGSMQTVLNLALVGGPLLAGLSFDQVGTTAPYALGGLLAGLALLAAKKAIGD